MPRHRRPKLTKTEVDGVMAAFAKLEQQRPTPTPTPQERVVVRRGSVQIPKGMLFSASHKLDSKRLDVVAPGLREKYRDFSRTMAARFFGVVALEDVRIDILPEVDVADVVNSTSDTAQQLYNRTIGCFSPESYRDFEAAVMIRPHPPTREPHTIARRL